MIENARNAMLILLISCMISLSMFGVGLLNQPNAKSDFTPQYQFVKATTHIPIIEINFNSAQELMAQAQKLNTTTIYDTK